MKKVEDSIKNDRPRLDTARRATDVVLNLSSATNGKLSQKSYEDLEQQTGMPLKDISSERASEKFHFKYNLNPESHSTAGFGIK